MPISRNCRARSETKLRWPHGTEYLLARACKDHDCADNNTVLLYSAAQGVVYGKANRQRRSILIGAPPPAAASELDRLWQAEWRQNR
jgi:Inhibitor of vertebrate lysozyme (Ivy)